MEFLDLALYTHIYIYIYIQKEKTDGISGSKHYIHTCKYEQKTKHLAIILFATPGHQDEGQWYHLQVVASPEKDMD